MTTSTALGAPRNAIILCGGLGSRMSPLSDHLAKPLLPIAGTPVVMLQIIRLAQAGVRRIILAVAHRSQDFLPLLDDPWFREHDIRLELATEPAPLGTAGALQWALGSRGEPAAQASAAPPTEAWWWVLNGDLLSEHELAAQAAAADPTAGLVMHTRRVDDARPFGALVTDPQRPDLVRAFAEKSENPPSQLINAGTYLLRPAALAHLLPARGAAGSLESGLFPAAAAEGLVRSYECEAPFRDIGTPEALRAANVAAIAPAGSWVASDARVAADAQLSGGSAVHSGAVIEAGCRLEGTLVLPGARICAGTRLENAVVNFNAVIDGSDEQPGLSQ